MVWLRLTIDTDSAHVSSLTGLLEQFDAGSVSYQPVSDEVLFDEKPGEDPLLWKCTSVTALLDPEIDLDILLACVRNRIGTENIHHHKIEYLEDENWIDAHRRGCSSMEFGGRLIIQPGWDPSASAGLPVIIMEPGLAFGTGQHDTTALCLDWLAGNELAGKTVIDYGCGSGILSLAALRLGADKVYAVDIDRQAILASGQNAENNGLQDRINISIADEAELPRVDVLLANILFNPLVELAESFGSLVLSGGDIVLSGILSTQVQDCLDCYNRWFNMDQPHYRNEWALLHGSRIQEKA